MLSSSSWIMLEVLVAVAVMAIAVVNMPDSWCSYLDEKGIL